MQSKTLSRAVLILPLLILNVMVAAVVHPFNLAGFIVMNVTAIVLTLGGIRLLRK
jgi:hypothetical protein